LGVRVGVGVGVGVRGIRQGSCRPVRRLMSPPSRP
jgi:hypothetical protein